MTSVTADQTQGGQQGQGGQPAQPAQPAQPVQPAPQPTQPAQQQTYQQPAQPQEPPRNKGLEFALNVGKVIVWLVYAYVIFAIIVLAFAFFLLLFGANPEAGFAEWIYTTALRFMEPFAGLFEPTAVNSTTGSVFDVSFLFAIVVYALLAWLIHMVYEWLRHKYYITRYQTNG
jgi:hypothetical protein